MIYGNIAQLTEYHFLDDKILACLTYAKTHDMSNMEPGHYEIDGIKGHVNICEYITTTKEERFWEAHKQYIDIHYIIDGSEQIDLNFITNMEQKPYEEENDFLPLKGEKAGSVILNHGDFLICFPNDGHRTAISPESPKKIKKGIFKVII